MSHSSSISLEKVERTYKDGVTALKTTDLSIKSGEVLVLLGPSGCGKSTLLRMVSGLDQPTKGKIYFDDKDMTNIPTEKRKIGFVFQNYALFPTMTVAENICFGMKLQKMNKEKQEEKLNQLLELMNIKELKDRRPVQLSGGQQQRVAIARALATDPKILLMDEPLTALDAKLKDRLIIELSQLFKKLNVTTVYVTHDQKEAMAIADRIAVMNHGVIEQIGMPQEIYSKPASAFVAQFVGHVNRITGEKKQVGQDTYIDFGFFQVKPTSQSIEETIEAFIRPEDIVPDETSPLLLRVKDAIFLGERIRVEGFCGNQKLMLDVGNDQVISSGDEIHIRVKEEKIIYG